METKVILLLLMMMGEVESQKKKVSTFVSAVTPRLRLAAFGARVLLA